MVINSFKRYEQKYYVTTEQKNALMDAIASRMVPDSFCLNGKTYKIRNIYMDTDDNQLVRLSVLKPLYKEKIRIRKYGTYHDKKDCYFLELKKKINGIVVKRRICLNKKELNDFINQGIEPQRDKYIEKQVIKEISYFLKIHHVHEAVFIVYDRMAFFDKKDNSFRISFDSNIQSRRDNLDFENEERAPYLLPEGIYLMEVKIAGAMPLWFASLLSKYKVYPTSFSKYGTEYKQSITKGII